MLSIPETLFVYLAVCFALLVVLVVWLDHRFKNPGQALDQNPVSGPKELTPTHNIDLFIPMPHHIKTAAEVVAWMTKDMPKLMAETQSRDKH